MIKRHDEPSEICENCERHIDACNCEELIESLAGILKSFTDEIVKEAYKKRMAKQIEAEKKEAKRRHWQTHEAIFGV